MTRIRDQYHVAVAPGVVFDIYADPERVPDWYANVSSVSGVTSPLTRPGANYVAHVRILGRAIEARVEAIEVVRPDLLVVAATAPGGGRAKAQSRFVASGGGTDVSFELDLTLPGGIFGSLAERLFLEQAIERDLRHANATLKALVELENGSRQP
jgi:uncharacterized protein YndB with AHSA1/START domain